MSSSPEPASEGPALADDPRDRSIRGIVDLLLEGGTPSAFLHSVLCCMAEAANAPHAVLEVTLDGEVVHQEVGPDPEPWRSSVRDFLEETRGARAPLAGSHYHVDLNRRVTLLGIPLVDPAGEAIGRVVLVSTVDEADAQKELTFLHGLALVASAYDPALGFAPRPTDAAEPPRASRRPGKAVACALVAIATAVGFVRVPWRLSVPCVVAPAIARDVSAPFGAVLRSAPLVAGDRFRAGDLVYALDTTDLELERARLLAEDDVYEVRELMALAAGARSELELVRAGRRYLRASLAIVEREIAKATLIAPFDGLVLAGDARHRVGDTMAPGERLFQLAPERDWKLVLEIPETDALSIRTGISGVFASRGRPGEERPFEVSRIRPTAERRDGATVWLVEAEAELGEWMLGGMGGVAELDLGSRRLAWVLFHRAIDRMRLGFWL